ncbi:MAG: molybdopterin-synthase adenylyltransferase MoeB, partial [Verrucomicrobiales bacterium]
MTSPSGDPANQPTNAELSPAELQRYARHLTLPEVGLEGQQKLKAASVLCIGAGGLGSPATMYLAAAGVGRIGLVDADTVEASNLQRQILHGESDTGRSKLESAANSLREINPHLELECFETTFRSENAIEIARNFDIILDGTDNFPTRYLSNDVSVFLGKPNIYGSIFRFEGQCSVFAPHLGGPCYRCMFPEPPEPGAVPSCAEGGVLGVLPGIVGSLQALEAIKLILEAGKSLVGRLVHFDALAFRFREFKLRADPACPVCGENPSITEPIDYQAFCGIPSANAVAAADGGDVPLVPVTELAARLRAEPSARSFTLLDVREPFEGKICAIDGATLIPLGELGDRLGELDPSAEIIVFCKAGFRSEKAARLLLGKGFSNISHVPGGITAWAQEIEPE